MSEGEDVANHINGELPDEKGDINHHEHSLIEVDLCFLYTLISLFIIVVLLNLRREIFVFNPINLLLDSFQGVFILIYLFIGILMYPIVFWWVYLWVTVVIVAIFGIRKEVLLHKPIISLGISLLGGVLIITEYLFLLQSNYNIERTLFFGLSVYGHFALIYFLKIIANNKKPLKLSKSIIKDLKESLLPSQIIWIIWLLIIFAVDIILVTLYSNTLTPYFLQE